MSTSYPVDKGAGRYAGKDPHVAQAFREVSRAIAGISQIASPTGVPISFLAKITGVTGGKYAFQEAYLTTAGTLAVLTGGRSSTITAVAIAAGGAGYVVGDVLTLSGGTSTTTAQVTVTAVAAGVVSSVALTRVGVYTIFPSNAVATTGGTGAGCTITISTNSAIEKNGYTASLTNQYVTLTVSNDILTTQGQQTPTYSFDLPPKQAATRINNVLVPCNLSSPSAASSGSDSAAPSINYTVKDITNTTQFTTGASPQCGRTSDHKGKRLAATKGMWCWTDYDAGSGLLWWADEPRDVSTECT